MTDPLLESVVSDIVLNQILVFLFGVLEVNSRWQSAGLQKWVRYNKFVVDKINIFFEVRMVI